MHHLPQVDVAVVAPFHAFRLRATAMCIDGTVTDLGPAISQQRSVHLEERCVGVVLPKSGALG